MKINPKDDPINNYDGTTEGALKMATCMLYYIRRAYDEGMLRYFGLKEQERLFVDTLGRVGEICIRKVDQIEKKEGARKSDDIPLH